ncbi:TonB-dependent receptor [Pseudoxanthomonas sp. JBR18]|uniref:TonB-dependent receptor n=1 Tax=Pseudoxanthomonas sp. JBR18 TaxID=2969308 RepID=UPI002305B9FE|nr:TonB-dependent receptor [Pseudoxanthomonas sp. JBR18]WCE04772.1 TonB-dependent receptor [Pseudoxanthomonas sp. JBR18]
MTQGAAYAQSTSGNISGSAADAAGSTVQITSNASGVTRDVTVDASGHFRAAALPTGTYTLTMTGADGVSSSRTVNVVAGQTTNASFDAGTGATSLDTVVVRGLASVNSIDLSSVESRTTFTADKLNTLPVPRDITSVSLLTPGTIKSSGYFGNASFGGASAAENSYYVNGFNITNLYDSLSFSEVPFQAIDQLDVQTGGYGAEYGFSTGGVTSVNVKRGTNEWHGGFSWTGEPSWGKDDAGEVYRNDGGLLRSYKNDSSSSNTYTAWVGGPLIKDKLFIFALGEFGQSNATRYSTMPATAIEDGNGNSTAPTSNSTTAYDYESKNPYWLVKLDWYPNDSNHVEYTGFDNSSRYTYDYYDAAYQGTSPSKTDYTGQLVGKSGGQTNVFKWTSYLTDNLTGSIQYGKMRNQDSQFTVSPDGVMSYYDGDINGPQGACPYVYSYITNSKEGCAVTSSVGILGGRNERTGTRLDFDWQLGDHKVGLGYSDEKWKSKSGSSYSGGSYWYVFDDGTAELDNFRTGGGVEIGQKSWYLEDNWQITDNFMLYAGVRNDSFDNKNGDGVSFVKQDDIWQPRLGFSWDLIGDGSSKLFGSLGRYSLPIAANVALRAATASYFTITTYEIAGQDPSNAAPIVTGQLGEPYIVNGENGTTPDPKAVASAGLKPYTQDEAILGYQQQISSDMSWLDGWTVGIKGTYRRINHVIDDTCDTRQVYLAAQAQGYDVSSWGDEWGLPEGLPGCYLYNPGEDMTISLDVDGDGTPDTITVDGKALGPKAKRYYKAVTLSADKQTDKWYVSANYTWSKLNGNYEGLVKSTNGQDDTGTTSDFDFAEIMYGSDGYLFNDHRHSFKLYGGYKFNDEWQVGANLLVQSGAPISCLGGGYGSFGTQYGYSGVFHTCNVGEDDISKQGASGRTPWTASLSPNVVYKPQWLEGLSAQLSVMNLFNNIKPLQVYETRYGVSTSGRVTDYYNYKVGKYYTDPRTVRLQVQYDW